MAHTFMHADELRATRHAFQNANDVATLLALAQRLSRRYPNDPDARQLLVEIAAKRDRLAGARHPSQPATAPR